MEVFMPGIDITLAHNNISTEFLLILSTKWRLVEIGEVFIYYKKVATNLYTLMLIIESR